MRKCARRDGGIRVISLPSKRTRPAAATAVPVMALNKVVLPAPLGPMTARRAPASSVIETPSTAFSAPNCTVMSRICRSGLAVMAANAVLRPGERQVWPRAPFPSGFHALECPGIRRLLQVGFWIIFPELGNLRIAIDGYVPELPIGPLLDAPDIQVVNR